MTLTHDHNGNLTGGTGVPPVNCGVRPQPARFRNDHRQDAGPTLWNHRRGTLTPPSPSLPGEGERLDAKNAVATCSYDGLNRRIRVAPASCRLFTTSTGDGFVQIRCARGLEAHATRDGTPDADGLLARDGSEHQMGGVGVSSANWRVIEETDAATTPHTLAQTVYLGGMGVSPVTCIDEPVCRDRNTDPTFGGSADNDCVDSSGSKRYFYCQDANFRVVALTDESAAVVERYEYSAYGEPHILGGTGVSPVESGAALTLSSVGNPLLHQGLRWDDETGLHENRYRTLHSRLGRFMQRDPALYRDGQNLYAYQKSEPTRGFDPKGLWKIQGCNAVMEPGDTLWGLAQTITGNGLDWPKIGYTGDPATMRPGTVVSIKGLNPNCDQPTSAPVGPKPPTMTNRARREVCMKTALDDRIKAEKDCDRASFWRSAAVVASAGTAAGGASWGAHALGTAAAATGASITYCVTGIGVLAFLNYDVRQHNECMESAQQQYSADVATCFALYPPEDDEKDEG